jgi:hypothetical protein
VTVWRCIPYWLFCVISMKFSEVPISVCSFITSWIHLCIKPQWKERNIRTFHLWEKCTNWTVQFIPQEPTSTAGLWTYTCSAISSAAYVLLMNLIC